jgi:hypothetical protein
VMNGREVYDMMEEKSWHEGYNLGFASATSTHGLVSCMYRLTSCK